MRILGLLLPILLAASPVAAGLGDTLYVSAEVVELKEKPDASSKTVVKLNRGHKLLEFERKGNWINVGAEKTGGKDGWLPISATSGTKPSGKITEYTTPEFERFKAAFWELSNRVEKQSGMKFFIAAEYMGDGIVKVVATDTWLAAPADLRKGNLETIFALWEEAEGSGLPIAVYVYDRQGKQRMKR